VLYTWRESCSVFLQTLHSPNSWPPGFQTHISVNASSYQLVLKTLHSASKLFVYICMNFHALSDTSYLYFPRFLLFIKTSPTSNVSHPPHTSALRSQCISYMTCLL
jgi:hypothetical protein